MEQNNGQSHKSEDEDRLSMLTDDILSIILERVDISTAAKTSVLSTRWKHIPWLLCELAIDVKDFLSVPRPNPIEIEHMDKAMSSLTKAVKSFLATPRSEVSITRLQLKLYLANNYSDIIGPLISQAVDNATLKDLDLSIVDEKEADDCYDEEMIQQARTVDGFFSSYPSVHQCLTKLTLYNICFAERDINHLLFDCCKQLQHLCLFNCDEGGLSAWRIHAPDSKLRFFDLDFSCLGKLEVLCLPKLERLFWNCWMCANSPLSFDVVPSLKELNLICSATRAHRGFNLSEILRNTTSIHNLTLNFQGEKLWLKPEGKQLCTAFSRLKKLSLHGIFIEFDLLWTIVLLEAAPSVEIFDIEIWEHPCIVDDKDRGKVFGKRTNPSWKVAEFRSQKEWLLKEVHVTGFSPMQQQIIFIRALMQRASNLQTVVLKDHLPCRYCEKIGALPRSERFPAERLFPKGKDERDRTVEQLTRDISDRNFQIIFGN